eukprot:TRINITY_DN8988_c0_g1_i1.p1 TRINITY_DN8988_c0_g1~~TRINITY_DN8988_c0_g1_i1.p1  ORF type:complete len:183 (+),score=9.21 TRINITY_DN8988_c0_g1_i1:34-582(+)
MGNPLLPHTQARAYPCTASRKRPAGADSPPPLPKRHRPGTGRLRLLRKPLRNAALKRPAEKTTISEPKRLKDNDHPSCLASDDEIIPIEGLKCLSSVPTEACSKASERALILHPTHAYSSPITPISSHPLFGNFPHHLLLPVWVPTGNADWPPRLCEANDVEPGDVMDEDDEAIPAAVYPTI